MEFSVYQATNVQSNVDRRVVQGIVNAAIKWDPHIIIIIGTTYRPIPQRPVIGKPFVHL